MLGHQLAID